MLLSQESVHARVPVASKAHVLLVSTAYPSQKLSASLAKVLAWLCASLTSL